MSEPFLFEIDGECPICEGPARMVAKGPWLRGTLMCTRCENGSVPRERALALVLGRVLPNWRDLAIHESSPANRGISLKLRRDCSRYVGSHYFPDRPLGTMIDGYRNEDIERQTFADASFDLVVTLDVFEHVFDPAAMLREIYRTLKPGGWYLCTFPIRKQQVDDLKPRIKRRADGTLEHLEPPEYHGNPISGQGALVTYDYGYDIHRLITYWTPFEVEISRFANRHAGILGEYTEVIACRKPEDPAAISAKARSERERTAVLVAALSDDQWIEVLARRHVHGLPPTALPRVPPPAVQSRTTGAAGAGTFGVGLAFVREVRRIAAQYGREISSASRVVDFGAGWGRMAVFMDRLLGEGALVCVEPQAQLLDLARELVPRASFHQSSPLPPINFESASVDVVYAYSVFSHLSEICATAWMKEFARILKPGGVAVLTTRSREHIAKGGMSAASGIALDAVDQARLLAHYDQGNFAFLAGPSAGVLDGSLYGEAAIPNAYAAKWVAELTLAGRVEKYHGESYVEPALIFIRR